MKQALPFLLLGLLAARGLAADAVPEAVAVPAPLSMAAINAPIVVARIKAGELTSEQAWQQGQLKEDDLLFLLEQEGGDRGSLNLVDSSGLSLDLTELLVKHYPELVAKPERLSANVRFRLGHYYFTHGDPMTAALFEGLLREAPEAKKQDSPLSWYYPVVATLLTEYYQAQGQYPQARDTMLRALATSHHPGYVADWTLKVARIAKLMGNDEEAREYYAKVPQLGSSWFTGVALFDQANDLIQRGRYKEAQQMLQNSMAQAQESKVSLLSLLGRAYYLSGDFDAARRYSQEAIDNSKLLLHSPHAGSLESQAAIARGTILASERWSKQPFTVEPDEIKITVTPKSSGHVLHHLYVRCFHDVPLSISTDDEKIKAQLLDSGWPSENGTRVEVEKEVIVQVTPAALDRSFQATLIIKSPESLNFQVRVPVDVELARPD